MNCQVLNRHPDLFEVIISPLPSRFIEPVRRVLQGYKIQECGPHGGPGYRLGEGEIIIRGYELEVDNASRAILTLIRGNA